MNDFSRFNPLDEAGEQDTDSRGGPPIRDRLVPDPLCSSALWAREKVPWAGDWPRKSALPFRDADQEIETAAGMTIPEIFAIHGETHFRDGERRVIARLLQEGPMVLATGGGAFMNEETRDRIARQGISVWLRADLEVLMRRVRKRSTRPLLQTADPEGTMRDLITVRHPVYATADLTVDSHEAPHDRVVIDIIETLDHWLENQGSSIK